jgi:hypothetical protein
MAAWPGRILSRAMHAHNLNLRGARTGDVVQAAILDGNVIIHGAWVGALAGEFQILVRG